MGVEFKKLSTEESQKLKRALEENTRGKALQLDPLTTGWIVGDDEVSSTDRLASEEALINAIQSVPCHYIEQAVHRPGTAV